MSSRVSFTVVKRIRPSISLRIQTPWGLLRTLTQPSATSSRRSVLPLIDLPCDPRLGESGDVGLEVWTARVVEEVYPMGNHGGFHASSQAFQVRLGGILFYPVCCKEVLPLAGFFQEIQMFRDQRLQIRRDSLEVPTECARPQFDTYAYPLVLFPCVSEC